MKKFKLAICDFFLLTILSGCNSSNQKDKVKADSKEKSELVSDSNFVKIGNQLWSRKNLRVSTFQNGDQIPEVKTNEEWIAICEARKPAWCYFENNPKNDSLYGKLYNWYAVNDQRGLAPKGQHIASNEEWIQLIDFLGGKAIAGRKMKSKQGWEYDGNSFSANPAGERHRDGEFSSLGLLTAWWTSTENSGEYAWEHYMYHFGNQVSNSYVSKAGGFSVRSIKD
jgi:uncharacterized protein (TIGR02145 family)